MVRTCLFHGVERPLELMRHVQPVPNENELLVRIGTCTLCRSDLHTHSGRRREKTPAVLGHEIVGRIEQFGPTAAHVDHAGRAASVGDRITWTVVAACSVCFYCRTGLPQKCEQPYKYGHERATAERPFGGGLADVVVLVPGTAWYLVPENVPDQVAAMANCATATAAALVRHAGSVRDCSVLILGAGVLGMTLCAMVRAAGAKAVIAVDPSASTRDRAAAFGATHVLSPDEEFATRTNELTGGRGADVIFEVAGLASTVQAAFALARIGGTVILAGTVAPVGDVALNPEQVVRRMLTIRGVHNYHPSDLETALNFLSGPGSGYPFGSLVAAGYRLDEIERAFEHAHSLPGLRIAVSPY